ncbi:MAG: RNA-binding protein, partial [uncultured bacterium]
MEQDQAFVEFVVKALVDNPSAVTSERTVDEMGVLITLKVDPADLGQVIGRQGQTAKSIRTLLRVVGAKHHARVNLKIYEPDGMRARKSEMRNNDGAMRSNSDGMRSNSDAAAQPKQEEEVDLSA